MHLCTRLILIAITAGAHGRWLEGFRPVLTSFASRSSAFSIVKIVGEPTVGAAFTSLCPAQPSRERNIFILIATDNYAPSTATLAVPGSPPLVCRDRLGANDLLVLANLLKGCAEHDETLICTVISNASAASTQVDVSSKLRSAVRDIVFGLQYLIGEIYTRRDVSTGNRCPVEECSSQGIIIDSNSKYHHDNTAQMDLIHTSPFIVTDGDGNYDIRISSQSRNVCDSRSGTLPFMAACLLKIISTRHSSMHDLESTCWLLSWTIALIVKKRSPNEHLKRYMQEKYSTSTNCSPSCATRYAVQNKTDIILPQLMLDCRIYKRRGGGVLLPFTPLLRALAILAWDYNELSTAYRDSERAFGFEEVKRAFGEYLDAYSKNPPTERSWDHILQIKYDG